ncbi:plastocyanin/azurin family copper-binding protein [Nocardia seriolae]|uniref:Blue (type 1) copper domain-containing protein n=2 Tax=Nocardia seriolae TaxID=37332 RepID=A0ABC9YYJ6_9NOCA|nr:plastocyanin/azurin family copper-binding protein [Nocardia seriolae]APA97805.1 hypothetical protein NS506_03756 [Nocardia seriolae]MTJ64435.1 hypothetical protein [Nocardia seriolae]MTJ73466.1 hypothetical protein [Nocardia seriolae]MTJ87571.1 hypothetical protein [Nocardia seriolae]MTK31563.1 hypothetical protein [Nocardia seriolae]
MNRRYLLVVALVGAIMLAVAFTVLVVGYVGWGRSDGMMGGHDPGTAMGARLRDAPGPRVSEEDATRLGAQTPIDAAVDPSRNSITFIGPDVRLVVLASPVMPAEDFRIVGLIDPTITVPEGARVHMQFINADDDMAHGLMVTRDPFPMMMTSPAFRGAEVTALGDAGIAGMHTQTIDFTADVPGSYRYVCPVPGHAEKGMSGAFVVVGGGSSGS